ncbi:cytochrome P450 [Microdochium trichocladiopsis]|uniref:Cytochrome P450 n=1 Tax=Microdochium trichocladiopsis TaxID=1682393 RepID=A0A9P8Y8I2_9PEZI|nr:cytochrome P450 [Microdochium trichocladiopsis]KAH7034924.1 cytochrome P450 [Microdochium trichocladiopsis]
MADLVAKLAETLRDNPPSLIVAVPAGLAAYLTSYGIYNIFFHPLRSFPGPLLFRLTTLTKTFFSIKGTLPFVLRDLHDQYGPIVRISPTELSFADPAAVKEIYGHRLAGSTADAPGGRGKQATEFPKLDAQVRISDTRPNNILNAPTHEEHAFLRKKLAPGFSDRSMRAQEPTINGYVDLLVERLRERAAGPGTEQGVVPPVDMKSWVNWATFDIIGNLGFGSDFGCLESGNGHPWVESMSRGIVHTAKLAALNSLGFGRLLGWVMDSNLVPAFVKSRTYMRNKLKERLESPSERFDFLQGFVEAKESLSFDYILSNAAILILAGSETTATLLTGATYLLLSNPDKLARATHEVRTTFDNEQSISLSSVQQQLPYLLAVLDESLRRYPPVTVGLARVVADEGGAVICGSHVPKNTTVAVWQWVTNHDDKLWHDPYGFHPERFLRRNMAGAETDQDGLEEEIRPFADDNLDALMPFGTGPRNCIGKSLAYAEMRLILARLLYAFDMSLATDDTRSPDQGTGQEDAKAADWLSSQRAYFVWEKPPLMVNLRRV